MLGDSPAHHCFCHDNGAVLKIILMLLFLKVVIDLFFFFKLLWHAGS